MYIEKYWRNYIGGTDDSLNLVAFLADQQQDEISLSEIFRKIGLDKQNWNFRQTAGYLEFTPTASKWIFISPSMSSPIWPPSCWSAMSTVM